MKGFLAQYVSEMQCMRGFLGMAPSAIFFCPYKSKFPCIPEDRDLQRCATSEQERVIGIHAKTGVPAICPQEPVVCALLP